MTITEMLDLRHVKWTSDNKKRITVTMILAWQPSDTLSEQEEALSLPITPIPKKPKEGGRGEGRKEGGRGQGERGQGGGGQSGPKEVVIKKEPKRPISAGSVERNSSAKRLSVRRLNVRTRADALKEEPKEESFIKEELTTEEEQSLPELEEQSLPELEEIIRNAGME
jgi:hypothetical protein